MHVIGARFEELDRATAALGEIRARVRVAPGDVAVRPLGSTRYEAPAKDFLLAGRFEASDVDTVVAIVAAHDGSLIERRVERVPRVQAQRGAARQSGTGGGSTIAASRRDPRAVAIGAALPAAGRRATGHRGRPTPPCATRLGHGHPRASSFRKRPRRPAALRSRTAREHRFGLPEGRQANLST